MVVLQRSYSLRNPTMKKYVNSDRTYAHVQVLAANGKALLML